eukprot:Lithocolla_globosa_v1_NODE_1990_length_2224_cov_4.149378.p3 type:complete len:132 gc:universal NODE_1990_length_2224_cov_4.149378:1792-2187(+)
MMEIVIPFQVPIDSIKTWPFVGAELLLNVLVPFLPCIPPLLWREAGIWVGRIPASDGNQMGCLQTFPSQVLCDFGNAGGVRSKGDSRVTVFIGQHVDLEPHNHINTIFTKSFDKRRTMTPCWIGNNELPRG